MNDRQCAEWLRERDCFWVLTHKNPDGDTVGSAAALCSALRRLGKRAFLYPNPGLNKKQLPYAEPYFAPGDFRADYVISVDIAGETLFPSDFSGSVDLAIDHHPTNSHFAGNERICADKASCGEIILGLIEALCGDLTKEEATLLYIAVSTDTGCFQYANTNAETFAAAAKLVRYGAENFAVNHRFFRKVSLARLELEGMIYSNLRVYRDGKIVFALITREMLERSGATKDDFDDLAGLAGRAEESMMNVTVRELPDGSSKVSVRSYPGVSSSAVCAVYGGGGHEMAAGCTIPYPPEQAAEMLLKTIDEVWP